VCVRQPEELQALRDKRSFHTFMTKAGATDLSLLRLANVDAVTLQAPIT
jgi:hypothetical protein